MAEIRPTAQIASKWSRNSQQAVQSYTEGVQNPRRSWQAATRASEGAYEQGVTAAIQRKSFGAGVSATTDEAQKNAAATKGAARYAGGIAAAESKYEQKFAPYAAVIKSVQLPPRGPRGAAQNLQRVTAIATALNQARTNRTGGGNR